MDCVDAHRIDAIHVTKLQEQVSSYVIEKYGRHEGTRTPDLYRVKEAFVDLLHRQARFKIKLNRVQELLEDVAEVTSLEGLAPIDSNTTGRYHSLRSNTAGVR